MGKALKQPKQGGADFGAYYGGVKKDGGFLKLLRDKVEKDPLLGEKDRWQTHAKLQQLERQVTFPNGQATQPVVDAAHGIIKSRRKGSEAQALGEDAFIKESILDNPAVPDGERLGLARKANKARSPRSTWGMLGRILTK